MRYFFLCLFCLLWGFPDTASAKTVRPSQLGQAELAKFIRESDHVLSVAKYKREIVPDSSDTRRALLVSHAFIVHTWKGSLPEESLIVWVQSMEVLMDGRRYSHQILPGEPFLHVIIGDVHGGLNDGAKVMWSPVCFSKKQPGIFADFTNLRRHAQEWEEALKTPRREPPIKIDAREWQRFNNQIESFRRYVPEGETKPKN